MVPKEYLKPENIFSHPFYFGLNSFSREYSVEDRLVINTDKLLSEFEILGIFHQINYEKGNLINRPNNFINDAQFVRIVKAVCIIRRGGFHLYLSGNQITFSGIHEIAEMLKVDANVETLDLSFNRIDEYGLRIFEKILEVNYFITELNLYGNPISDQSLLRIKEKIDRNKKIQQEFSSKVFPKFKYFVEVLEVTGSLAFPEVLSNLILVYCISEEISKETFEFSLKYLFPKIIYAAKNKFENREEENAGFVSQERTMADRLTKTEDAFRSSEIGKNEEFDMGYQDVLSFRRKNNKSKTFDISGDTTVQVQKYERCTIL